MTKILLRFSEKQIDQPITSKIILSLRVPMTILNANITAKGGEILAEVPSKDIDRIKAAFKQNNVEIIIQKGITVDFEKCINCGACYSLCPVDAISFQEDHLLVFSEEKCISCSLCVNACPTRALRL